MDQQKDNSAEKQKAASQIAYFDEMISSYLNVIEQLNAPGSSDESQILIKLATESIEHCENKRKILINYQKSLEE